MSTPSNTPSTYPVEREAVHADSFPDTVTDEEDAFETDDESTESESDDTFDQDGVAEDEEVMEDEGGIAGAETRPVYLR
jgi:hypothetical protein